MMNSTPHYYVKNENGLSIRIPTLEKAKEYAEEMVLFNPQHRYEILKCVGVTGNGQVKTSWLFGNDEVDECDSFKFGVGEGSFINRNK